MEGMSPTHALTPLDIDRVTTLIERVGRDVVLPRFRNLASDDVEHKLTPGFLDDVVTVVDRESELALTAGLREVVDTHVVGEEAAHDDKGLVDCLQTDASAWVVDPIDGTHNFVSGHDGFGIMVAFVADGRTIAGWVHLPARGETFVAVAGGGARLNGAPLVVLDSAARRPPHGSMFVRFMPDNLRQGAMQRVHGKYVEAAHAGAAAVEYTDILRGRKDFAVYYRLHPWDHAAPALILAEAGGCVAHVSGAPYTVRSPNQLTIVATTTGINAEVGAWLADVE